MGELRSPPQTTIKIKGWDLLSLTKGWDLLSLKR